MANHNVEGKSRSTCTSIHVHVHAHAVACSPRPGTRPAAPPRRMEFLGRFEWIAPKSSSQRARHGAFRPPLRDRELTFGRLSGLRVLVMRCGRCLLLHVLVADAMQPFPVVVRRMSAADAVLIEVRVNGRPLKSLQRPATEALANSLSRVSKAFTTSKKRKKVADLKYSGDSEFEGPIFLFDSFGAQLDPSMSAIEAWLVAARLRVGCTEFDVLREPAEVVSLMLPSVPLVGVPLIPAVETRDCDAQHCHWTWERLPASSEAHEWEHVCSGREYVPADSDIGARLRVRAAPPASSREEAESLAFLAQTAEAAEPVTPAPPRRLLGRRVRAQFECL